MACGLWPGRLTTHTVAACMACVTEYRTAGDQVQFGVINTSQSRLGWMCWHDGSDLS